MTQVAQPLATSDSWPSDAIKSPRCPYCHQPLPSLLAICWQPACLSAEIAADQRAARAEDL